MNVRLSPCRAVYLATRGAPIPLILTGGLIVSHLLLTTYSTFGYPGNEVRVVMLPRTVPLHLEVRS